MNFFPRKEKGIAQECKNCQLASTIVVQTSAKTLRRFCESRVDFLQGAPTQTRVTLLAAASCSTSHNPASSEVALQGRWELSSQEMQGCTFASIISVPPPPSPLSTSVRVGGDRSARMTSRPAQAEAGGFLSYAAALPLPFLAAPRQAHLAGQQVVAWPPARLALWGRRGQ